MRSRRALSPASNDGASATAAEPSTTSSAPIYPRAWFIGTANHFHARANTYATNSYTNENTNSSENATATNVTNGVSARVALTREASQWARASANAP